MSAFFSKSSFSALSNAEFRSQAGSATLFSLLLMSLSIAALSVFAINSLSERNSKLRKVEFSLARAQLERNLNVVYNDPTYINEVLLQANETSSLWDEELAQRLEQNDFVFPSPETTPADIRHRFTRWIGDEVYLSYPWLKPCKDQSLCPIQAKLVEVHDRYSEMHFRIALRTTNIAATGPLNPAKPDNQILIKIERGMEGLVVDGVSAYCRSGYALQYFQTPPLTLRCRPAGETP